MGTAWKMRDKSTRRRLRDLEDLLLPPEQALWREYLSHLARGLRGRALDVLGTFIERLQTYSPQESRTWVRAWCRAHLDEDADFLLPYPLFARIIGPELRRGYEAGEPDYARWLARIYQAGTVHPRKLAEVLGHPDLRTECLLREALRVDPSDRRAARSLVKELARGFDYYIHEIPEGVLADPALFHEELDEFEDLVTRLGLADQYATVLRRWRFHCNGWTDYLRRRPEFPNYADYLSQASPPDGGP
jgi:hypothetical protein